MRYTPGCTTLLTSSGCHCIADALVDDSAVPAMLASADASLRWITLRTIVSSSRVRSAELLLLWLLLPPPPPPLCVALLDMDDFKRLNDSLGHKAGDHALIHLSSVIQTTLRPSDSVARYGGEEFVLLLPDIELKEAVETIERLQRELTKKFFLHENERVLVTFSAGVALLNPEESLEDVVGRADKAMYHAKKAGKNRVFAAQ